MEQPASRAGSPTIVLSVCTLGLALGGAAHAAGARTVAAMLWALPTVLVLTRTVVAAARELLSGSTGVDVIAVLAMGGALALGEHLAGCIIALMLTGGAALERYASARARRELTALLERAPRVAHRREAEAVVDLEISAVRIGDLLVVKTGEVVPTDGILLSELSVLDESALTGEARPVEAQSGAPIRSGATNAGQMFEMRATSAAAESTYAGIVRLVQAAETSKAPLVRLADRYAGRFLVATLGLAGGAWAVSGQATRALAVLVVATPCPLLLAAPAAILAGVSRAARSGIIIKGGGPLEALAEASVVLLDKTGTITAARPRVVAVESFGELPAGELVRLAACLEQLSTHPFAPAIMAEARDRGLATSFPSDTREQLGAGIAGIVEGRRVALGRLDWVAPNAPHSPGLRSMRLRATVEGSSCVFIAVADQLSGGLILQDPIRTEAPRALRALRKAGIRRIHMVTGDHPDIAQLVGDAVGIDQVFAERTPEEKLGSVQSARADGVTIMVGDGVNDAPALAMADVGVAMGARGANAASEAADVVLTADRLEGLVTALHIAQRTRRIALQSIFWGMGLSVVAMIAAARGSLAPVTGAVLQEAIDLAVLLNALRALGDGWGGRRPAPHRQVGKKLQRIHKDLRPEVDAIGSLATRLDGLSAADAKKQLEELRDFLLETLLPHEREEQESAYPYLAEMNPGEDPTGPLIQTHQEIARLARLFARMLAQLPPEGPRADDLRDLRRALYGMQAILTLHFAQEDELFDALASR